MQPTGDWLNQPGGLAESHLRLRMAAGLTGQQLADRAGMPRSKVSKLEHGRQMPTRDDIAAWAQACGRPEAAGELAGKLADAEVVHRLYRSRLRGGHAGLQNELNELVRSAPLIRNAEALFIPGLLQTPGYARARMEEAVRVHGFRAEGIDDAISARMSRQQVLYESARRFEFVIGEPALRLLLCPPQEMAGQLDRLLSASGMPNVTVGIIPERVLLPVAPMHGFLIAGDIAYVETHTSEIIVRGDELATYERVFDGLLGESVTGDRARDLIADAVAELRKNG